MKKLAAALLALTVLAVACTDDGATPTTDATDVMDVELIDLLGDGVDPSTLAQIGEVCLKSRDCASLNCNAGTRVCLPPDNQGAAIDGMCAEGLYLEADFCWHACHQDTDCPYDRFCDQRWGSMGRCTDHALSPCESHAECPDGQACASREGVCMLGCRSVEDCPDDGQPWYCDTTEAVCFLRT